MVPTRIRFLITPLLSPWHCGPNFGFGSGGSDAPNRLFTKGVRLSDAPVILFSVRFTLFKVFQMLENPVSPLVPCDARGETEAVSTDPEFRKV